jgi:hypothetical protein
LFDVRFVPFQTRRLFVICLVFICLLFGICLIVIPSSLSCPCHYKVRPAKSSFGLGRQNCREGRGGHYAAPHDRGRRMVA